MKLSVLQENLARSLSIVGHLASRNTSLPILNDVLISADDQGIVLSATNLEIGIRATVRGKVEEPGSLAIPARTFADFIGLAESGKIELIQEGLSLRIETTKSKTVIKGQSAEEFPLIPALETGPSLTVPAPELRQAISQVIFATAQDESRPEISGVLLQRGQSQATLVSTDSYRLTERKITLEATSDESSVIVPARTIQELARIISDDTASVTVRTNENQILFSLDGVDIVSRLVEGQYPDYTQIIPANFKLRATLKTEPLIKAVKTAGLFSKSGINDISLAFTKGHLTISAVNAQLGEYESRLEAAVTGDDTSIVFNHRYLLDGLQNIEGAEIELSLVDDKSPGVLRGKKATDYTYIIMPIKQ